MLIKISYFQNNFLHTVPVLGYLPKLKRVEGLAFGVCFVHDFFIKMSLIKYSIYGQSFNVRTFSPFLRYQTKCIIKFLFRQLMTS